MFYYIEGAVAALDKNLAVIDAGGVAFAVNTTVNTLTRLRAGEKARLYTYLNVGENAMDLYGFYDLSEKRCFELLLGVSGVGPKAALSVLSVCTPESLAMAVVTENEKMLTAAPGVGKRGAQRIILELRDKIAKELPAAGSGSPAPAAREEAQRHHRRADRPGLRAPGDHGGPPRAGPREHERGGGRQGGAQGLCQVRRAER